MAEYDQPSPKEKLEYIELSRLYDTVLSVYDRHMPSSAPGAPSPSPELVRTTPGLPEGATEQLTLYKKQLGDTCLLYAGRTVTRYNSETHESFTTELRYSFIASSVLHDGKGIIRASKWAQERQQPPGAYYEITLKEEGSLLSLDMDPYEVRWAANDRPISPDDAAYLRQMIAEWDKE